MRCVVIAKVAAREYSSCTLYIIFSNIVPTQVEKMRAKLANLNNCAVPFLSRAAVNLCWYHYILYFYIMLLYNILLYYSVKNV